METVSKLIKSENFGSNTWANIQTTEMISNFLRHGETDVPLFLAARFMATLDFLEESFEVGGYRDGMQNFYKSK